jgi:Tol biopolymer transport system component
MDFEVAEIRAALAEIDSSGPFIQSGRMRRFLSFVVEKAIAGESDHLKETVIGMEVFDRQPGYDPKVDPVVRNEARRLRAKLDEYYRLEQAPRAVRIGLPKGSYVPTFERVAPAAPPAEPIAAPKVDRPARGIRMLYIAVGLAVVSAAVAAGYLSRIAPTSMTAPKSRAFTSFPGDEDQPKFSPDGESIAFVWDGPDGKSQNIYVQKINAETPRRLTDHTAEDMSPVWSPDATQVAFLRVLDKLQYGIFTVPVGGGPERKWGEVTGVVAGAGAEPHMDWSPDGRYFAVAEKFSLERPRCIVLISAADGHRRQLTWPDQSSPGDSYPEFSPDAGSVAFRRGVAVSAEDIWVVPVAGGEARRVTHDNRGTEGHAWTADGRSVVVASRRDSSFPSLWRFALSGGVPVRLTDSTYAGHPAISRRGNRLSYVNSVNDVNIWRVGVDGGEAVRLIASTMRDTSPQYSPDGSRIAFRSDRNGYDEIWTCDRDGHDAMRITNFHGPLTGSPRWSPDSQELAFDTRPQGHADIYTVRADGGQPRRLTQDSSSHVVPSWSTDGRSVYYASNQAGRWQVWRQPVAGGSAVQVTKGGGFAPFESADGKYVYYAKDPAAPGIWRTPVQGGTEAAALATLPAAMWGNWALTAGGIFFLDSTSHATIRYFDLAMGQTRPIAAMPRRPSVGDSGLAVSPDGRWVLYSQLDLQGSVIMLMENFR